MDKRKILCYVLSLIVLFLFTYSIYGTASFLNIHKKAKDENSENVKLEELNDKTLNLNMQGNTSGNLSQHYQDFISDTQKSNGLIVFSDKYVYKSEKINNKYVITKTDIDTGNRFPLISEYKCRNLLLLDDYIFCIVETQNSDDINCEKIAKISIEGEQIEFFDSTESVEITSMVSDGEEIYYTKKDNKNIYKINLSGDIYSYIYTLQESGENPHLFGIQNNNLYYVDGYEMAYINLNTYSKTNLSYQYCNKRQNPILEDNKIFVFKTLSKNDLSYIDLSTNEIINIFTEDALNKKQINSIKITNINYYKNNLFFTCDNKIYYININNKNIELLRDTISPSNVLFFNNNLLITETSNYGVYKTTPIAYILAK